MTAPAHRNNVVVALATALVLVVGVAVSGPSEEFSAPRLVRVPGTEAAAPTTTLPPPPPTTVPPPPPTEAPPPPAEPPPPPPAPDAAVAAAAPGAPVVAGVAPYIGLGTWVDVYDWSRTFGRGPTLVGPADVDRMAQVGVQTLYIQTAKWDSPTDILDADLLVPIVERARAHGIRVVGWYLPTLEDPGRDLARLVAIDRMGLDGVAVDIEARNVADVNERNRRLIELSTALRQALPGRTLGAIVLPPVQLEQVNNRYWNPFPYAEIAPLYDVWLTMGYWSVRRGEWRDAYRYTTENIARLRRNIGRPDALVHPIGGIADGTTGPDVQGFLHAAVEQRAIGGSLYDWRTTSPDLWPVQQPFRSGA